MLPLSKPLNEFGGWLKFIQVTFLGIFIVFIYELVFFGMGLIKTSLRPEMLYLIILLLAYLILNAVLILLILIKMENQNPETPKKKYLLFIIGIGGNFIYYIVTSILLNGFLVHLFELLFPALFYLIALIYFKKSKRVLEYYHLSSES